MGEKAKGAGGPRRGTRLHAAQIARFLEVLAETGDVRASAVAAAAGATSFYALRERDTEFDARWKAALAMGYEAIEGRLLAAARGDGRPETFDKELSLKMLTRRDNAAARGPGFGRTNKARVVPIAEVEQALLKRLEVIARRWRA